MHQHKRGNSIFSYISKKISTQCKYWASIQVNHNFKLLELHLYKIYFILFIQVVVKDEDDDDDDEEEEEEEEKPQPKAAKKRKMQEKNEPQNKKAKSDSGKLLIPIKLTNIS